MSEIVEVSQSRAKIAGRVECPTCLATVGTYCLAGKRRAVHQARLDVTEALYVEHRAQRLENRLQAEREMRALAEARRAKEQALACAAQEAARLGDQKKARGLLRELATLRRTALQYAPLSEESNSRTRQTKAYEARKKAREEAVKPGRPADDGWVRETRAERIANDQLRVRGGGMVRVDTGNVSYRLRKHPGEVRLTRGVIRQDER
jgi:hypothetical protein